MPPSIWLTTPVRVHREAAVDSRGDARDVHLLAPHLDGDAERDVAPDVDADGDADAPAVPRARTGGRRSPAEAADGLVEDAVVARLAEVAPPPLDGIGTRGGRDLIDVRLAREVVDGGAERAVGAHGERRVGRGDDGPEVGRGVGRLRASAPDQGALAGVDRLVLPRDEAPLRVDAAADGDERGRPEGRVLRLFLAVEGDAHGPARGAREPRRLERERVDALPPEAAPDLGRDHAHPGLGHLEVRGELRADAEGPLRPRPHREALVLPARCRGARLHRCDADVRRVVAGLERAGGGPESLLHVAALLHDHRVARRVEQNPGHVPARRLPGALLPPRLDDARRAERLLVALGQDRREGRPPRPRGLVHDADDAGKLLRDAGVDIRELRPERGRPENGRVEETREQHVARVDRGAGHAVHRVDAAALGAQHGELARGGEIDLPLGDLRPPVGVGDEFAVAEGAGGIAGGDDAAPRQAQLAGGEVEPVRGEVEQRRTRGRGGAPELQADVGGRARAEGPEIPRHQLGVTERHLDRVESQPQLLGDLHREAGANALPVLDLTREGEHPAVGPHCQPALHRLVGRGVEVGGGAVARAQAVGDPEGHVAEDVETGALRAHGVLPGGRAARGALDGAQDAHVRAAAADVLRQRLLHLSARGVRLAREQPHRAHHEAGDAVAALHRPLLHEGALDRMKLAHARRLRRQPLDRRHVAAGDRPDRGHAGAQRLAVDQHRAGAAEPLAAGVLGAGQAEVEAQVGEKVARAVVGLAPLAVDPERRHASPSRGEPPSCRGPEYGAPTPGSATTAASGGRALPAVVPPLEAGNVGPLRGVESLP